MHAQQIGSTHPQVQGPASEALISCIEACYDCSQACTACADACLGEKMVADMVQCIRACLDCADVCAATGQIASRRTGCNEQLVCQMLEVCEQACRVCATECERHAERMEHCRICGEACAACADACDEARASFGPTVQ